MAEARAEVLEEIIKNQNGGPLPTSTSSSPASHSRSTDSLDDRSDSGDELTTYEKGVQRKFNSVSSSVNSFSSNGDNGEYESCDAPRQTNITPSLPSGKGVDQTEPIKADQSKGALLKPKPVEVKPVPANVEPVPVNVEPVTSEDSCEIKVIDEQTVKVIKSDGTLRGTVFGSSPVNAGSRPSAMQIARQLSKSETTLKPPVHSQAKSGSAVALTSVGLLRNPSAASSVQSEPTPPAKQSASSGISQSKSNPPSRKASLTPSIDTMTKTGTWFGSRRQPARPAVTQIETVFVAEREREDDVMALLDAATNGELDDSVTSSSSVPTVPVSRHGASRESYRNATESPTQVRRKGPAATAKREVELKPAAEIDYQPKKPTTGQTAQNQLKVKNNNELSPEEV